ncbi:MAG: hypothetical protein J1F32_01830 [Erysipelotrichales bacterium]|nr:hypothetical protein [Erysipelotrichales bacterium]
MQKKYTIRQAIDVASKYTYKNRLGDFMGYGNSKYWKKEIKGSSYDKGKSKEFIVTKRQINGVNHMVISSVKDKCDYLFYRTK